MWHSYMTRCQLPAKTHLTKRFLQLGKASINSYIQTEGIMGDSLVYKFLAPVLLTDTDENSGMLALKMQSRRYLPYLA